MRILAITVLFFLINLLTFGQNTDFEITKKWDNYVEVKKFYDAKFNITDATHAEYLCREMHEIEKQYKGVRLIYRMDSTLYAIKNYAHLEDNKLHGTVQYYNEQEVLIEMKTFVHGRQIGQFKEYFDNGAIKVEGKCKEHNFHLIDTLKTFYQTGQVRRLDYYDPNTYQLVEGKCFGSDGRDTTYFQYITEAEYIGGPQALQKWISENVKYPEEAILMGETGKVYLTFVVEEDGSISNVEVQKGVSESLNAEAVRVVMNMPNWLPGGVDGYKERTRCQIPIAFSFARRSKKSKRR